MPGPPLASVDRTVLSLVLFVTLAFFFVPSSSRTELRPEETRPLVHRDIPVAGCLNVEVE